MKNNKYIFSFFIYFSSLVFFVLFSPQLASADSTTLTVSPSLIHIEAKPPADIWTPFTIKNNSDQSISVKIGYKAINPQASSNGTVVFLNNGQSMQGPDSKIFDKMQIVDDKNISRDSIDLGPQQQIRLRLRITLPAKEMPSDYYYSLIFLQSMIKIDQFNTNNVKSNQKSFSTIQAGVGLNVFLSVGDKVTPEGSIEEFSTPSFINRGPVSFNLSIRNTGIHMLNPQGMILIKNIFGQTIGKVTLPASTILANTSRKITSTSQGEDASTTSSKGLLWDDSFLLGIYTATLTLALSTNGPVYTRTAHFLAVPFTLLIEAGVILLIVVYIYLRVKRKLE